MDKKQVILLGAHMSVSGGVHTAVDRATSIGCTALQVFTKNNNQWNGKPFTENDIALYKQKITAAGIVPVVSHDSYLINLCATNPDILKKSRAAFIDELERCEQLGIQLLNFHPGSHLGLGDEEGIKGICESLNIAHDATKDFKVKSVLEATAGQGTNVGYKFEHLHADRRSSVFLKSLECERSVHHSSANEIRLTQLLLCQCVRAGQHANRVLFWNR